MSEKMGRPTWFKGVIEGGAKENVTKGPVRINPGDALLKAKETLASSRKPDDTLSDIMKEAFLGHLGTGPGEEMLGTGNVDKSARQYVDIVRGYDLATLRNFRDHPDTKNKPAFLRAINNEIRRKLLSGDDTEE